MPSEEYTVERILDCRMNGRNREYLVKWQNYSSEDNTWEPATNLDSCVNLIRQYEADLLQLPAQDNSTQSKRKKTRRGGRKKRTKSKSQTPTRTTRAQKKKDDANQDTDTYMVEKILSSRESKIPPFQMGVGSARHRCREFLVKWEGWSEDANTWEHEKNTACDDLIQEFDRQQQVNRASRRSARNKKKTTVTGKRTNATFRLEKDNEPRKKRARTSSRKQKDTTRKVRQTTRQRWRSWASNASLSDFRAVFEDMATRYIDQELDGFARQMRLDF